MSNFAELKALINRDIRQNSVQAITGEVLNAVLNSMVVSIGSNYSYAGIISPVVDAGQPDANVFYISTTPGVYPHQGNLTMSKPIGIFKWNGVWSLDELDLDFDSAIEEERNARIAADNALMVVDNNLQSQITRNASDIDDIEALIPAEATASNQLADKAFVNSSIATNTATFVGTFETSADLPTSGVKNNDYAFVVVDGEYERYKYNGSAWVFEYTLNNSSFTAAQWAAVNSGITAAILQDIQLDLANLPPFTWDSVNGVWKFGGNLVVQGGLALEDFNYSGGGGGTSYTQKTWADIQLMTSDVVGSLASAYAVKQAYDQLASLSTNVSFSQTQTSGTLIGVITIDGSAKNIYAPSLSGYATEDWVLGKGYITSAAIPSYLPNPYSLTFGNKSYNGSSAVILTASDIGALTQHQSLEGYATEEWVESLEYITAAALTGYATQSWVQSLGYITSAALAGYATESWVESQNYLTSVTWSAILNKPAFAAVATSGNYNDLSNKPTIATLMGSSAVGGASSYAYWTGSAWSSKSLGSFAFISSLDWSSIGNRPPFTWDSSAGAWRLAANLIVEGGLALEDLEYSGGGGTTYTQRNWTYIQGMTGDVSGDLASAYAVKQAYDQLAAMSTNVSFSQSQTGGTLIGVITIDDVAQNIYAPTIPTSLKNPYALTFGSKTYDGSAARTILASDLGALTAHQSIYTLTFAAGAFSAGSFVANSAAKTINVPTHTSHLTNNSGYITADDIPTTIAWGNVTGKPTFAAVATSGSYNDLSNKPTIPTNTNQLTNGAGYITSAALAGYATESFVGSNYLPLTGGTIKNGSSSNPFNIDTNDTTALYMALQCKGVEKACFIWSTAFGVYLQDSAANRLGLSPDGTPHYYNGATRTLLHSGNIGDYNAGSATKLQTARTIWGRTFDGTEDIPINSVGTMRYLQFRNADNTGNAGLIGRESSSNNDIRLYTLGDSNLVFFTNSTQRMLVNSSGNVTIGAKDLAGSAKLYVDGLLKAAGGLQLGRQLLLNINYDTNAIISSSYAGLRIRMEEGGVVMGVHNGTDIVSTITYSSSGNVLIGTSTDNGSGARLQVEGGFYVQNTDGGIVIEDSDGHSFATTSGYIKFNNTYATVASIELATNILTLKANAGVNIPNGKVLIGATTDDGTKSKLQVEGRICSSGYTLKTVPYYCGLMPNGTISSQGDAEDIWVYNDKAVKICGGTGVYINSDTTISGNLTATGTIHASTGIWSEGWLSFSDLSSTSDARFKKDIEAISSRDALRIIKALKPCSWTWNELSKTQGRGLGFIAQEMQGILPEAIREIGDDKHLAINYQMLHALEVASIQKHDDEITRLRRRVESLEKEIQRLTTS